MSNASVFAGLDDAYYFYNDRPYSSAEVGAATGNAHSTTRRPWVPGRSVWIGTTDNC